MWHAQRLQRHFALAIPLRAGDVRTRQPAGATNPDAFGSEIHRRLHRALHRAAKRDPPLELEGDILRDELGVKLRLLDFVDVDLHLLAAAHRGDVGVHAFDFRALLADDESGPGGEERHPHAVPCALDQDLRHRGERKAFSSDSCES